MLRKLKRKLNTNIREVIHSLDKQQGRLEDTLNRRIEDVEKQVARGQARHR